MTPRQQRFCPLCERAFADGEAVLRCDGCGIMHHPACWVKNGGCATQTEHRSVPVALAYSGDARPIGQHPAEGTRTVAPAVAGDESDRAPIEFRPAQRRATAAGVAPLGEPDDEAEVIGAHTPPPVRTVPLPQETGAAHVRRRPPAPAAYHADRTDKPLPSLYGGHRILRYWYVPAAVLVAVAIALGVIWLADQFSGEDDPAPSRPQPTTTLATVPAGGTTPPGGNQTPSATASAAAPTGGKFQVNENVVVTGVGAGSASEAGCLNVRTEPGTSNPAIVCVPDGTQLTVLGGPQEAGGLKWWKVKSTGGDGWAAEDYLAKR